MKENDPKLAKFAEKIIAQIQVGKLVEYPDLFTDLEAPYVDEGDYFKAINDHEEKVEQD